MKETTPAAMPPCFDRWCKRFDDLFSHQAQKREFRNYIGGLLGESERKNLSQMAFNAVGVTYHRLHHFLTEAPWSSQEVNERRLLVMNQCSQTRISRGFTLIVDDSGHRKSGNFTSGVGRQYIGEIGKTDNGIVVVTTHLYDGKKSLPLDIELYQHASSLPQGKKDLEFKKKPELALALIDRSLSQGYRPGIVLIDAGYGNNTTFLLELEKRRTIAIVMNASTFDSSSDVDYFITNVDSGIATAEWIITTYSQRNWVEVFYREAKGWLGLSEYQVRDYRSLIRHFILVFCAYTFILWHTLTGGLRRRWATKPLNTFTEALEAFRTAMSFRFIEWLNHNRDVFVAYKAALGFVWA